MFNRLLHRTPREPGSRRGQGLVEFAILLPLILLLVLMAIDFGRVFFGWVGLQNVARIGAVHAALYPLTDWSDDSDTRVQQYVSQINADAEAINCEDLTADPDVDLSFPEGTALGAPVVIDLACEFDLITPLMDQLMGGPIQLAAQATFPIRAGIVGGTGGGGGGGGGAGIERTVPDLIGMSIRDARLAWDTAGFLGALSPVSGQDARLVTAPQIPSPGTVSDPTTTITVASSNPPSCGGSTGLLPKLVGLTVADARTSWAAAGFTAASFTPTTGFSNQVVTGQTATPAATWGTCVPSTTLLSVEYEAPPDPLCAVPDLVGRQSSVVQGLWSGKGFTTSVQFDGATPFKVGGQSIVQNVVAYCDTTVITVTP